jgi:phytol kinase
MLHNNFAAFIITLVMAFSWLRFVGFAVRRNWIPNNVSRKVIHIGTGPLFVLCWLLFDPGKEARFLAVIVPLASTMQFGLAGLGIIKDNSSVQSMSRSGVREELLKGPFLYGIAFIIITLIFWNSTAVGICALMIMCGGDGLADIFGKKYGTIKLPWTKEKTWMGSLAMLTGGFLLSAGIIYIFKYFNILQVNITVFLPKLFIVVLLSTLIESLSKSDIDNVTVPLTAVISGILINL